MHAPVAGSIYLPAKAKNLEPETAYDYDWAFGGAINSHRAESRLLEFTTVTDQAGKLRGRSKTDALGPLIRVDEPNLSNSLGSATVPTQPTDYNYDVLEDGSFLFDDAYSNSPKQAIKDLTNDYTRLSSIVREVGGYARGPRLRRA